MNSLTCQAANTAWIKGRPINYRNLKQDAAFKAMSDDQKRQLALKAMHKACKGLCDCWCHTDAEPLR